MDREQTTQLSIIVPVFNAGCYLDKCINSIVNQTYQNIEIILVNDGSTDNSLEICQQYQGSDQRIKIISKENSGLIRARKSGLSIASGSYIGFVDSDDWIEPTMFETLVNCMEETGCDLVSSGIIRDFKASGRQSVVYDNYPEGSYGNLNSTIYPTMLYHSEYRNFGIYCTLWNKLYKKELLVQVYKEINEEVFYGEDALACYPYCLQSESIYILHKAFYHYNIRHESMCFTPDRRLPYNNYLLYHSLQEIFTKSPCQMSLMRQLKKYLMMLERHSLRVLYQFDAVALDEWNFSFPESLYDKRFVLYGAGVCGQACYRKLCEAEKAQNMVMWIDQDAEKRTTECAYPINMPEVLTEVDWDILLVAVKSECLAMQIMDRLEETYHIARAKMCWSKVEHIPIWDIY